MLLRSARRFRRFLPLFEDGMGHRLAAGFYRDQPFGCGGRAVFGSGGKDPAFSRNTPLSVLARQSFPPIDEALDRLADHYDRQKRAIRPFAQHPLHTRPF